MNNKYLMFKLTASAALVTGLIAGCSTPTVSVKMNAAGEVKLNGVSKIALADFNTLPGDAFCESMPADPETCELVKRAVASAFYASPMYKISDLNLEKEMHEADDSLLVANRFDAFVYGRLWWQITPEEKIMRPTKYTLETWKNVDHKVRNPITKKEETHKVKVVTETRDVLKMVESHSRSATLMLALSIYRVNMNGQVEKIVDTYQVTDEGFELVDGKLSTKLESIGCVNDSAVASLQAAGQEKKGFFAGAGDALKVSNKQEPKTESRRDANGKLILTQKSVSMPSELQAKIMLASSVTRNLAAKLAPTEVTFDIPAEFGDKSLENLIKNGAYQSAREYALYKLRNALGRQVCDKVSEFIPEIADECSYPIPDSKKAFPVYDEELVNSLVKSGLNLYAYSLGVSQKAAIALNEKGEGHEKMMKYLAGENLEGYFYALGLCQESAQQLDEAMESYRFAFNVKPTKQAALGLTRTRMALGESAKLTQTRKARKSAESKTKK